MNFSYKMTTLLMLILGVLSINAAQETIKAIKNELSKIDRDLQSLQPEDVLFAEKNLSQLIDKISSLHKEMQEKKRLRTLLYEDLGIRVIVKNNSNCTITIRVGDSNDTPYPQLLLPETGIAQDAIVLQPEQQVVLKRIPYGLQLTFLNNIDKDEHLLFHMNSYTQAEFEKAELEHKDILITFDGCHWGDCSYGVYSSMKLIDRS